jgi:hypothetical protein
LTLLRSPGSVLAAHVSSPEDPMPKPSQDQPRFSLVQGGLWYHIEQRLGLVHEPPPDSKVRIWIGIVVALLPLVVLCAMQGVLYGSRVTLPLWLDLTIYARFLVGMPLLVLSERIIDDRLALAVRYLHSTDLAGERAAQAMEGALRKLDRALDSPIPEGLLLVGSFLLAWLNSHAILGLPVSSWRQTTAGAGWSTTLAGRWLDLVSLPLFNFLVFRWLWRIGLWSIFLGRVSRMDLHLEPTHPDGAAGLGFLGEIHTVFGLFLVPLAASVAARGVQWVQFGGGTIEGFGKAAGAFAVIGLAIALGPLFVFMPKLLATKRRGLLEYGGFALEYTRGFDQKWLRGARTEESPLGSGDIQSLADLANSYTVVRNMRFAPLTLQNAVPIVLSMGLPMVPFLTAILPLKDILKLVMQFAVR